MAGDRLTRILAVWSADTLLKCEDSFYLPVFALSLTHMCASHAACPLTVPVPHFCCASAFAAPQHNAARMAHFAQFDPPIPAQVAAIASAPLPTLLGCGLGVGSLLDDAHSHAHIALVFTPAWPDRPLPRFSLLRVPLFTRRSQCIAGACAIQCRSYLDGRASLKPTGPPLVLLEGRAWPVTAGRSFDVPSGLVLSGSPLCSTCEVEFHCYVCVGVVPPAIAGPPKVPLVTITVPSAPTA